MRRSRLLLAIGLGLVAGAAVVLLRRAPPPTTAERRPATPAVQPRKLALQADAEGSYVPGYEFTLNRFRFTGFSLRPEALVTFTQTTGGPEQAMACLETLIRADTVHLRCDDPQVGTVTIDGRFLTRLATNRLDTAILSAIVTVRSGSGEVLYRARDSFRWHPADAGG